MKSKGVVVATWIAVGMGCHAEVDRGTIAIGMDPASDPVEAEAADPTVTPALACEVVALDARVGMVTGSDNDMVREPLVTDGTLFLHRRETSFGNAPNDLEVFALAPAAGVEEQITANDSEDLLVDARQGAMLLQRSMGALRQLVYRDAAGEIVVAGGEWPGVLWDVIGGYNGAPRRMVDGGTAVWRENGAVFRYANSTVTELSAGAEASSPPYTEKNRVIWTSHDGQASDVWLWAPGGLQRLTDDAADDRYPVVSGPRAFWIRDGAAVSLDFATDAITIVDPGPCGPPHADDGEAVFACAGPDADPGVYPGWLHQTRLVRFDGVQATELTTRGGLIYGPRIANDRVAWLEYPESMDFCYGPTEPLGEVVVNLADDSLPPHAIAEVGAGCYCCDAYWPEPVLSFDGAVVAWNYPKTEPTNEWSPWPTNVGHAVLTERRECR